MSTSVASHIPVLSLPKFKTFGVYDGALAEVLEPYDDLPSEPTVEERLQAEFERGLAEGSERTRAHYEAILEAERAEHARLIEEERVRFDMREAANVSASIEGFVDIVEQRLSYSVAKLLQPFLKDRIVDQLVAAFAVNLRQLTEDDLDKSIRLRGPETLVARVLDQVPALRDRIEVQQADQVELVALFDETTIETRLGQWFAQVDMIEKEVD
ncbi:hypothetical protein [Roseibium sediminicola]|uniref:Flagellar assembly protein FliH/Type III secretion system HrpE domain-containing protein n=1 Tax=Roseibium sediminicola TaxID=2933272 RepID=A0ABT0GPD1_9HYPH|nr:hypothetical protein [Roseibium sp. CAU 1639]MCK7611282.1 hypothetical protein [Roseibium sp. CAU 1639]